MTIVGSTGSRLRSISVRIVGFNGRERPTLFTVDIGVPCFAGVSKPGISMPSKYASVQLIISDTPSRCAGDTLT